MPYAVDNYLFIIISFIRFIAIGLGKAATQEKAKEIHQEECV